MAITTTTASAAIGANDEQIVVASATGFAAGNLVKFDEEWGQVLSTYVSGTTIPIRRGLNGTVVGAHPSSVNVITGLASDFGSPNATVITAYSLSGRRRKVASYSASGAITLPLAGEDLFVVLNGTSALAMTIAAPSKDLDGSHLVVVGNGAANHTVQFTGGLSGAGTNYDVITVNATAPIGIGAYAVNGLWISLIAPAMTGTVTNITGGIA